MKVSIVIPVYNAEKYLAECIESALNQTYKNIEIIAVNDGSTDNSLEILKKYSDRIKIIEQNNKGAAIALNVGIQNATGEWIKKFDADDVLYPNAVELLIKAAITLGEDSKSCIFYTDYEMINSSGKKLYDFIEPDYNNLSNFERGVILLDHCIGNHITSLIHKSIFEKHGYFNGQIKYVEDYEFWLRCQFQYNCKFFLIPTITAKYRIHESQLTQTNRKMMASNSKLIQTITLDRLESPLKEKYIKALKIFQKNKYPLKIRIILYFRDILIKILPSSLSGKILNQWRKSNTANQINHQVMSSWTETDSN